MIFNIMFYGGLVLFILFLAASVILFFKLEVLKAIGIITGKTQKKAIEEIRSGERSNVGKRGKGSFVKVRDLGTGSGLLKDVPRFGRKKDEKRNSDASEALAAKAANDARLEAARAMAEKAREKENEKKAAVDVESESTEVLTYNESKKKQESGEETTSVLEEEQATDVLSADGSVSGYSSGSKKTESYDEEDDSTDVLKSSDVGVHAEDEEATDILRSTPISISDDDDDDESEENVEEYTTDVLATDMGSKFAENEIYGTYNPEMTAVLRSDMSPGEDSVRSGPKNIEGITVLYSETIVHTDESL
jgi:hypothetical protein